MSQKYLDLAGLTAYDKKVKEWFKAGIVDITNDAINALFPVVQPNNEIWFKAVQPISESDITTAYTNANVIGLKHEDDYYKIVYDDVVTIINWANSENPSLLGSKMTEIYLPNSVTSIREFAFAYCTSLTSITIGNSVTSIGNQAFSYCDSLTSVTIPNSVTSIGGSAFSVCTSLNSITIPNSVTNIGEEAFYDCYFSKDGFINNSSLNPDDNDYWGATIYDYKTNGVFVKDNVAIKGDDGATSVVIPTGVTRIGSSAFSYCYALTSITIPNSVTSIGGNAFRDCYSLTSVTIPESVTSIGNSAFYNCHSITSVTFDNGVTSIGDWAFERCSSITSITIPNSVTSIGEGVFGQCSSLTSITFEGTIEEWNAIDKYDYWNGWYDEDEGWVKISATYVQCTDGQVAL